MLHRAAKLCIVLVLVLACAEGRGRKRKRQSFSGRVPADSEGEGHRKRSKRESFSEGFEKVSANFVKDGLRGKEPCEAVQWAYSLAEVVSFFEPQSKSSKKKARKEILEAVVVTKDKKGVWFHDLLTTEKGDKWAVAHRNSALYAQLPQVLGMGKLGHKEIKDCAIGGGTQMNLAAGQDWAPLKATAFKRGDAIQKSERILRTGRIQK